MCYRPVKILNPSRRWNFDAPKYLFVPCGKCADCQRVKHNEWYFRCMIEYEDIKRVGGAVYFITLTYNEHDLPLFTTPDGVVHQGFCKRDIHNFIKYLRIYLKRQHLEHKGIKYLICSEYGSKTKRPHYHGLLFVPYHIPNFSKVMQTCWKHGFIICSKKGWEIVSPAGIRYASKYICKDFGYFDMLKPYMSDKFERKAFVKEFGDFLPRHWQSVGFGP